MWVNDYVGLPFVANGRDHAGLDCWGLYRLVLAQEVGVSLPVFDTVDATNCQMVGETMTAQARVGETWTPVDLDEARTFDCVLMRSMFASRSSMQSGAVHVGCFVEPSQILHIEKRHDAVCQPVAALRDRISGIYRHRALVERLEALA